MIEWEKTKVNRRELVKRFNEIGLPKSFFFPESIQDFFKGWVLVVWKRTNGTIDVSLVKPGCELLND